MVCGRSLRFLNIPFVLFGLLGGGTLLYFTEVQIEAIKPSHQQIQELSLLPSGEVLKPFVLGYDQVVADLIWLQVIQVVGEKEGVPPEGYRWIDHALDVLTTLDPKFDYAYQFGGVILSELGRLPEESNRLLQKGADLNPTVWQIPFYMGFNYFFHLKDYQHAATRMSIAAQLPGSPQYLPRLAARLFVQAKDPQTAIAFLQGMILATKDETVRKSLLKRIEEIRSGAAQGIR